MTQPNGDPMPMPTPLPKPGPGYRPTHTAAEGRGAVTAAPSEGTGRPQ